MSEKQYKFVWPECSFEKNQLTGEECKRLIEEDLKDNIIKGVTVEVVEDDELDSHIDEVGIRVNSMDQVIGKSNDALLSYKFQWSGHPIGPWSCLGRTFIQCCRMIQRRTPRNEDGDEIGCYREQASPRAIVHKGLQDDISFTEYVFNEQTKEIELTYVEKGALIILVHQGSDGKVHELPYLDAETSLNPAEEFASFIAESTGPISSNSMSVAGGSGPSVFVQGMGDTWWYGIPLGIAIFSGCSCCAFVFYMCCIPVKDEDLMAPEKFVEPEGVEEMGQQSKTL